MQEKYENEHTANIMSQLDRGHKLNCMGMIYDNYTLPCIKDSVVLWSSEAKCLRENWPNKLK